jgi:hypothetical protein
MPHTNSPTLHQAFQDYLNTGALRYSGQDMDRIIGRISAFLQREDILDQGLSALYLLDEFVLASQGDKARSAEMVLGFYRYLNRRYGHAFDSELMSVHLVDNPAERQIEMVKYLHQPRSRAEMARHFGLEPRTIRKDLQQLAQGTSFLGVTLQAEFSGRDLRYRSSQHPVFLVMDLSQAYAGTVGLLKLLDRDSETYAFYARLAASIYAQLSDYAKDKLREQAPEEAALLEDLGPDMAPEWQAHRASAANRLLYLVKSGQPATISLYLEGEERTYREARLQWLAQDSYRLLPREGAAFDIREQDLLAIEDIDYQ